jgi:hypothetical protein
MQPDPILEEIHRIRQEYAGQFNYDVYEIIRDLKEQEKKSGRIYVSLPVKRKISLKEMKTEIQL